MPLLLNIDVKLEVLFDEKTNSCKVLSSTPTIITQNSVTNIIESTDILTISNLECGTLTLGSKHKIGGILPKDTSLNILYRGEGHSIPSSGTAKTNKSAKGRVDGLTKVYNSIGFETGSNAKEIEGDRVIDLSYDVSTNTLFIEKGCSL